MNNKIEIVKDARITGLIVYQINKKIIAQTSNIITDTT